MDDLEDEYEARQRARRALEDRPDEWAFVKAVASIPIVVGSAAIQLAIVGAVFLLGVGIIGLGVLALSRMF